MSRHSPKEIERIKRVAAKMITANPAEGSLAAPTGSATGPKYPATMIVHTPSGPVAACDIHAGKIANLMSFLGAHCAVALAAPGAECENCVNEAKSPNARTDAQPTP